MLMHIYAYVLFVIYMMPVVMIVIFSFQTYGAIRMKKLDLTNWTFINSTADLSQYVGQRVTIGFKYTSNSNASATWEVKNFVVE